MNPEQTIVMITANSRGPIDFSRQQEVRMLQKPFELEKLDLLKAILSSMQSVEAEESNTKDLVSAFLEASDNTLHLKIKYHPVKFTIGIFSHLLTMRVSEM